MMIEAANQENSAPKRTVQNTQNSQNLIRKQKTSFLKWAKYLIKYCAKVCMWVAHMHTERWWGRQRKQAVQTSRHLAQCGGHMDTFPSKS